MIYWRICDDAGAEICSEGENLRACVLPASGAYTIVTGNEHGEPVTYQIAVAALYRSAGCVTGISLRWDQAAALVHRRLHRSGAVLVRPASALDRAEHRRTGAQRHEVSTHAGVRRDGRLPLRLAFDGAALTVGGDAFSTCRGIAAGDHTARETFAWRRTAAVVLSAAEMEATFELTRRPAT